jgi:hypothetical protein
MSFILLIPIFKFMSFFYGLKLFKVMDRFNIYSIEPLHKQSCITYIVG